MISRPSVTTTRRRSLWTKLGIALAAMLVVLVLVVVLFPWDVLREPINRYVSEKTGRKFEITRRLDVGLGLRTATVKLDGIEFANPSWARDPYLVKAERAEFDIRLWPLLTSKIVIPRIALVSPIVGLQMEGDGRRTWALGKDSSDAGTVPTIGSVQIDNGAIDFLASSLGIDLHADLTFDTARGDMPLSYKIKGKYQKQPLAADGRAGNVLQINAEGQPPFPLEINATAGNTKLTAAGSVAELSTLDGVDAKFSLKGQNLGDLFPLLGIALPQTSPYALSGELRKKSTVWEVAGLKGKLGLSDIGGDMKFDQGQKVPFLSGSLRSRVMDMDDLGPLIGLPPTARSANAVEGVAPPPTITQVKKAKRDPGTKVLPTATLDFERLRAMNADVTYVADRITNVRELPLDRGSVHVVLKDSVLTLDPLDLGIASGKVAGAIRIDAASNPADIRASLTVRAMQLNRLIPKVETLKTSFGKLDGRVNLSGRGNSVASWLATSSGDVAAMTGRGEFSNLLLEFLGLDGGEVIKFLLKGDHNVVLRCGAVAFDVNKGLMTGRSVVFDTTDTVFNATGNANLANETLDFVIRAQPKDVSILSLRTPLLVRGTFGSPSAGVEVAPLATRGLAALALSAINPLLALAATIETGPGQDADCRDVLAQAEKPSAGAAAVGAAKAKTAKQPVTR
ncbi:AsmA family protein [Variovorax sp. PAMC 28711]|uniref:AsmA family protein n=1 Tax=Variovorax sp. PAMC 28711 TaxID=1795631 RepID=UPI00078E75EE|nr:membrane assembly protein AsmA [Variovorax sp. PAMC 28711]